jgi:hypothetical protein
VKPSNKQYVQFSKRITVAVTIMWCAFRMLTIVLIAFRPETATALTAFQQGADDVMMVAIGFYCGNSVAEKGILGYFKARNQNQTSDDALTEEENASEVG